MCDIGRGGTRNWVRPGYVLLGVRSHTARPRVMLWFLAGGVGVFLFFAGLLVPRPSEQPHQGPILLQEVRDLGELRAVSHHVSRVFEHETHREPEGWAMNVPLARQVVAATTRNKVLVSAEGDVQAGVDLSQAELTEGPNEWTVRVPAVTVFEPVVKVFVHGQRDGLFWRDLNIVGKAEEDVSNDMVEASLQAGIRERAEKNISAQLKGLFAPMTEKPVRVVFGPSGY